MIRRAADALFSFPLDRNAPILPCFPAGGATLWGDDATRFNRAQAAPI